MEVRITKAMYEAHEHVLKKKPFDENGNELQWHSHITLDLSMIGKAGLLTLKSSLEKTPDVRGCPTLAKDIANWIAASESKDGAKNARARSTKQACKLLIEYIRNFKRKHIYERLQEGNDGVTLCYYVDEIEYEPPHKGRDYFKQEYITIKLVYEEFGIRKSTAHTVDPEDCLGRAPHEILAGKGLMTETVNLRCGYEDDLANYSEIKDLVGKQYLAVGVADDQGIDGNEKESNHWYRSSKGANLRLDKGGEPSRVVIDIFRESEEDDRHSSNCGMHTWFWNNQKNLTRTKEGETIWNGDSSDEEDTAELRQQIEVPVHPYVACFDLKRHKRLRIHVGNLSDYVYETDIRDRLVLPEQNARLIDTLLIEKESHFKDVIKGKSGGTIIMCQGPPGVGKTLTAEIYAEAKERALYTVQCSQLGVNPEELEDELMKVFARARRWGAILLLDEADVYVHERGNDLQQNAIVGVFLRVLEYFSGVLFLTTNRGDLVDDAILSRCTARVPYKLPTRTDQIKIWRILAAANDTELPKAIIREIVEDHPNLSGRDIKNLLKLAGLVAHDRKVPITSELISEVKIFKPTCEEKADATA